jgi:hypothetical protein
MRGSQHNVEYEYRLREPKSKRWRLYITLLYVTENFLPVKRTSLGYYLTVVESQILTRKTNALCGQTQTLEMFKHVVHFVTTLF